MPRSRSGRAGVRKRVADLDPFRSRKPDDVAGVRLFDVDPVESAEGVEPRHPRAHPPLPAPPPSPGTIVSPSPTIRTRRRQPHHPLTDPHPAPLHPPDRDPPHIRRVVQRRHQHLERPARVHARRRNVLDHRLEERCQPGPPRPRLACHPSLPSHPVEERGVELRVVGLEVHQELQHLIVDLLGTPVRPVHLVYDHHWQQPQRERLSGHEAGLRHRPLGGIHQEQHAVDHAQDPLHLAAEVRVPRRIDDVDLGAAPLDGGVLGEDRDAALPAPAGWNRGRARPPPVPRGRPPAWRNIWSTSVVLPWSTWAMIAMLRRRFIRVAGSPGTNPRASMVGQGAGLFPPRSAYPPPPGSSVRVKVRVATGALENGLIPRRLRIGCLGEVLAFPAV